MTLSRADYHPIKILHIVVWANLLIFVPLAMAVLILGVSSWDLSIPLAYSGLDDIWQLSLTKFLKESGWIFTSPYLGAPGTADWHYHAAGQTSALHSVLMLALSPLIDDSVKLQQIYYILNFPLICITTFLACRLLNIARLPAYCAGLLFAFTTFRFDSLSLSFLSNYFMVPLALVPVIWVLSGRFTESTGKRSFSLGIWAYLKQLLRSRDIQLGIALMMLTAASDGYYAFFTLLLLGFAFVVRILIGDWRQPASLLPTGLYIGSLLVVALALQLPLHAYKASHISEFKPNGVEDPFLVKYDFEAEFYSTTLKMLIAPIKNHRLEEMRILGAHMGETHNAPRKEKVRVLIPLGTLAASLFVIVLILILVKPLKNSEAAEEQSKTESSNHASPATFLRHVLSSLTLFIFLCSIIGGVGTLIALGFPTIRAYQRFPLFLICVLYFGAAAYITLKLDSSRWVTRLTWGTLAILITAVALYDQIPIDARKADQKELEARFLAERRFVRTIEAELPPDSMVYQYPYSQYLSNSKYYGWGAFSHIRLYLHSQRLRWSNGGSKNSPADDWNYRISQLPLESQLLEIQSAGFKGLAIDRTVVSAAEYEKVRRFFNEQGYEITEDTPSKLAFIKLRDSGIQVSYDPSFRSASRIFITDPAAINKNELPRVVDREALNQFLLAQLGNPIKIINKAEHPDVFVDDAWSERGLGGTPINPLADMQGAMTCQVKQAPNAENMPSTILLTLTNKSKFDWRMGNGQYPLVIGISNIRNSEGKPLPWNDSYRIPADAYIRRNETRTIPFNLDKLPLQPESRGRSPLTGEFLMLQEGNAWFHNIKCEATFR